jgi:hypothetical protein
MNRHRDDEGRGRERPLDPVFHSQLCQPVAGVQNQCDHRRADAVENGAHRRQATEIDVERAQRRHDDEVGQDERPPAGPRTPEAAADVGDPDADLNGERPGQRLAYGNALAHLVLREPFLVADELTLHLPHKSHRPAKAEHTKTEEILHELSNRYAAGCGLAVHRTPSDDGVGTQCNA